MRWAQGRYSPRRSVTMANNRTYNNRNQLWTRVVLDSADPCGVTVTLDYDRNGNLTSDGEKFTYVFNPFGQLVAIKDHSKGSLLAEFTYSGLGHRISERTDTSDAVDSGKPDGLVDGSDRVFYIATDPQGRRVATFRKNDEHPKETFVWTPAGVSGPGGNVGGALILRDRVADASSPEYWAVTTAEEPRPERHYSCSDSRLSVVALIGLAEQYRYSATGMPYGIPLGDVNSNGEVEIVGGVIVDKNVIAEIEQEAAYQVRADLDLDGLVDSADIAIADAAAGAALGRGMFSAPAIAARIGFSELELLLPSYPTSTWAVRSLVYRSDISTNLIYFREAADALLELSLLAEVKSSQPASPSALFSFSAAANRTWLDKCILNCFDLGHDVLVQNGKTCCDAAGGAWVSPDESGATISCYCKRRLLQPGQVVPIQPRKDPRFNPRGIPRDFPYDYYDPNVWADCMASTWEAVRYYRLLCVANCLGPTP